MAEWTNPVLVVVDVQQAIDDARWGPRNNRQAESTIATMLGTWRARGWPVLHVRHDSTEGASPYRAGQPGNDFKAEVAPAPEERIIAKKTNSAFIGTDLENVLRELAASPVVYCGVLTHNSLEATVRMSGNLGFASVVVSDGCWSVDVIDARGQTWSAEDVHHLSLAHLDGEYAQVLSSIDVHAAIGHG